MLLADLTWPEVPDRVVLVVPLGSCEQHGPHLPLDTDTRIAEALARALVDPGSVLPNQKDPSGSAEQNELGPEVGPERWELAAGLRAVLAPTIAIGASGEHEGFPGTLSIGTVALEAVLIELVRSAMPPPGSDRPAPFAGVVVVNGHGGNVAATSRAAALLSTEGRAVLVWHPRVADGDSHAGRTETSILLHLDPGCVRTDLIEPGSTARWREIGDVVVAEGLRAVTPNGVLGDPTTATAAEGATVLVGLVDDLRATVTAWADTLEP